MGKRGGNVGAGEVTKFEQELMPGTALGDSDFSLRAMNVSINSGVGSCMAESCPHEARGGNAGVCIFSWNIKEADASKALEQISAE